MSGTRFVLLTDGEYALQLILDEPPQHLYAQFIKQRVNYYMRFEPNSPTLDAAPLFPPTNRQRRVQLRGEDSNHIWRALLSDPDIDALIQLVTPPATTTDETTNDDTTQPADPTS
jgi:hypothetical protein